MQVNGKIVVGFLLAAVGLWLVQKPICTSGCKTVAEHLLTHGIEDIAVGLFA